MSAQNRARCLSALFEPDLDPTKRLLRRNRHQGGAAAAVRVQGDVAAMTLMNLVVCECLLMNELCLTASVAILIIVLTLQSFRQQIILARHIILLLQNSF